MKIAYIVPALTNSGPVNVVYDLVSELIKQGHSIEVFYFDKDSSVNFPCETHRISFFRANDIAWSKFDIVHSHCLRPNIYVQLHAPRGKERPKYVSTLHQPLTLAADTLNHNKIIGSLLFILDKWSHKVFDRNILLSQEQLRLSSPNLNKNTLSVIGNGRNVVLGQAIDKTEADRLLKIKADYKIVGSISVVNKGKGLEQIIKALPALPDWFFLCVGDGPQLKEIEDLAAKLGVLHRCWFIGYKKNACAFYQYFDVFIMTTRSEGFPLSFIEAAANAKPTVLSNIPILKSITTDDNVVFYELDNINSLVSALKHCYEYRDKYSHNLLAQYHGSLTATYMANQYLELYKQFTVKNEI